MPLYYSGDANDDGCLAIGKDCWAAPKDLKGYWQWPFDLEVLVLAGCSALNVTFSYGIANGPGTAWAALLKRWGDSLTAILGYRDKAPSHPSADFLNERRVPGNQTFFVCRIPSGGMSTEERHDLKLLALSGWCHLSAASLLPTDRLGRTGEVVGRHLSLLGGRF